MAKSAKKKKKTKRTPRPATPSSRRRRGAAIEERAHPRVAPTVLRTNVELDGEKREGYLLNVSLGGGFLVLRDPPGPEDKAELHVVLPWGLGECRLEARSIWCQTDERDRAIGAGIAFENLGEEARTKLQGYLDRFVALSAEITA